MDLTTRYLGMTLNSPIMVGASPLTMSVKGVKACAAAGAGAVTLKSLFEEQIRRDTVQLDTALAAEADMHSEVVDYMRAGIGMQYGARDYLRLVQECKQAVTIPVIASLNCISDKWWLDFAREIEAAGADALELNIAILPERMTTTGAEIEQRYVQIVREARRAVNLPIAVKLGPYFSSLPQMILMLKSVGADGFVLFNRFYRPTIDLATLRIISDSPFSSAQDLSTALRALALLSGCVQADLAASGGVADGGDVVRTLLAGANVAQSVSGLLRNGVDHLKTMTAELCQWMQDQQLTRLADFQGRMSQAQHPDGALFNRTQYIKGLTETASTFAL